MSDSAIRFIRTIVPIAVGTAAAFAAKHLGIVTPDTSGTADLITGLAITAYYTIVRALETRWPQLGWLLGAPKANATS